MTLTGELVTGTTHPTPYTHEDMPLGVYRRVCDEGGRAEPEAHLYVIILCEEDDTHLWWDSSDDSVFQSAITAGERFERMPEGYGLQLKFIN